MTCLTADHVVRSHGLTTILKDVSLAIDDGERVGLVGVNGSGKSTLAKVLAGLDAPEQGVVARRRGLHLRYLSQEPELDDAHTVFESVESALGPWRDARAEYESISERLQRGEGDALKLVEAQTACAAEIERLGGWEQAHRIDEILAHLGLRRPEQRVASLSGGERRRVALAQVLVASPDLAILDEPTNHLDADTIEWLEEYLRDTFRGALLVITHDRFFLDRVVTRILELDRGVAHAYEGAWSAYVAAKAERLAHEAKVESRRLNLLRREQEWLSRGPAARTTKQKARIQRAEALDGTVREARRREETVELAAGAAASGKRIVELEGVALERGGRTLLQGLDLVLGPGDRLGVIGPNGAGKTTLIRAMLGEDPPAAGRVTLAPSAKVAYFDQSREGLDPEKSVYDNLFEGSDRVYVAGRWMNLHGYLEDFLFESARQRQKVALLSGGERARLALARILRGESNLLVLDEPTNDLDVATLGVLEELLVSWPGCAVIVTHDRAFLDRVATSILAFEGEGKAVRYAGGWSDYRAQRAYAEAERARVAKAEVRAAPVARAPEPAKKKLTMSEQKELDALPDRVDAAEAEVQALEAKLADPALYASAGGEVPALMASMEQAKAAVEALLARWEALEARRG
ncbi:MAG: ABC-F family ATP-binding cassette domain-containing protein [Polyangiales bacterium]